MLTQRRIWRLVVFSVAIGGVLVWLLTVPLQPIVVAQGTGTLTGLVTTEQNGNPIEGVRVSLFLPSGFIASRQTDVNGRFTIPDLPPEQYIVQFESATHFSEYYNNQPDFVAADRVSITAGQTTEISAQLVLGGQVMGRVTSEVDQTPLAGVGMTILGSSSSWQGWTDTNSNGNYTITGIPTGQYKILANPGSEGAIGWYLKEYYDDATDLGQASLVTVTEGQVTSNIDIALALGGRIHGKVTSSDNGMIVQAKVSAYDNQKHLIATTEAFSDYTLTNLPPGQYRLLFDHPEFFPEYYNDQASLPTAHPVDVTAGNVTDNIDVDMMLRPGVEQLTTLPGQPGVLFLTYHLSLTPSYSLDDGATWQEVANTPWMTNTVDYHLDSIALVPRNVSSGVPVRFIVGEQQWFYRSGDYGQTWAIDQMPFPECDTDSRSKYTNIAASPLEPNRLYAIANCVFNFFGHGNPQLFTSLDSGLTWNHLRDGEQVYISPVVPGRIYLLTTDGGLTWYQSNDYGQTWVNANFPLGRLVLDGQNANNLYMISQVSQHHNGQSSSNGGQTWSEWANNPCEQANSLDLIAQSNQSGVLFMQCNTGLYRSNDGGNNWTRLSSVATFGLDVSGLVVDYGQPGRIWWFRPDGLWFSLNNGRTWTQRLNFPQPTFQYPYSMALPVLVK